MSEAQPLIVYVDGAYSPKSGFGGWAWALHFDRFESGTAGDTTNQRMELTAALQARTAHAGPLEIVSDSAYVVNCFRSKWYEKWLTNGWRNAKQQPVENQELWEQLITHALSQPTTFRLIKGHSGHPVHDFVDNLAVDARKLGSGNKQTPDLERR